MKSIIFSVIILLSLMFFSGCVEEPTTVGFDLLPQGDLIEIKYFDTAENPVAQRFSSFKDNIDLGDSRRLLLGRLPNVESSILLKFFMNLPDSLSEGINADEITILSSWVKMETNYRIGDEFSGFDFQVYKIESDWQAAYFNLDSLRILEYDEMDISDDKNITDTLITFSIKSNIAMDWLKAEIATPLKGHDGIYLRTTPGSASNAVFGFQAISNFVTAALPRLYIEYSKPGVFTDTLIATPNFDVHVLEGDILENKSDDILLQCGLANRGKLWFSLDAVPDNAIINSATLELKINPLESLEGTVASDTLWVSVFQDSAENVIVTNINSLKLSRNDSIYSGEITSFVQSWVNGVDNQGMRIRLADEKRSLNSMALKNSSTSDLLRPRLKIYYTFKN